MFERPQGGDRALLVSLDLGDGEQEAKVAELRELAASAALRVIAVVAGAAHAPRPRHVRR